MMRIEENGMRTMCVMWLSALAMALPGMAAAADAWPTKPLRAVVPAGAGSTVDIVPRVVFEQLSRQLGQTIVVENRPGAGTTIGSALVARANADGYTFLVNSSAHTITPSLYRNLSYQPARDLVPVVPLGISPQVLVVSPAARFKTVGDLIAAAKAKPGGLNFSSVGVGTSTHMAAERFRSSAKVAAVHVPFKGGAEAMSEVIAGRVEFFFGPVGLVLPQVRDGKLVALAVNGTRRSAALPEVSTTREAGLADAEYPFWFGVFLPAKTPREIVDALHRETLSALQAPKVRDKLAALGIDPMMMSPKEFATYVQREFAVNAALVKAIGLKLD
jgi:tripartite-type tricarboxylate transporter receptor subunit TctC